MAKSNSNKNIESQEWFVVNSQPFKEFMAATGLENISKVKHNEEYELPDGNSISVSHKETIFLVDKKNNLTMGTLPEDNKINKPVMKYRGGVVSRKRLEAFIGNK